MKKFTKLLVLLLTLALVCTGLLLAVGAEEEQEETASYKVGEETQTGTLADAVAAADAGTTVTLLGDCTVSEEIAVAKSVTVDLNGYAITTTCASAFNVNNGEAVFNITGTGNITSAGTLVKATADGATINVTGTGFDGITIEHTGTVEKNRVISLQSNTLNVTNVNLNSHSGAQVSVTGGKREYTIGNTGTSVMTFNRVKAVSDIKNLGFGENGYFFFNVASASKLVIENSSFYSHNNFMRMTDSRNGSVEIRNSVISANDTGTAAGGRLAVMFANTTASTGTVDIYDSLIEGSGRMFASEQANTPVEVNSYGSTFKILEAEKDLADKKTEGAYLQFNLTSFKLYNSESGNSSKIIAASLLISRGTPSVFAPEPGLRVNFKTITTATNTASGIKVPKTVDENGNVTEWTYAVSSADDAYAWVYDPIGDADAPFVLVDTTKTTVSSPDYFYNTSFDSIRFNTAQNKNISVEKVEASLMTTNQGENFKTYLQYSAGRGSLMADYETGNAYFKYIVTPYDEKLYPKKDASGNVLTDEKGNTLYYTLADFYSDPSSSGYKGTTRNFETERNIDGGAASDPFFITGKNNDATFIASTSYTKNKVVVNEFDFGCDSEVGFPAIGIAMQSRKSGTDVANSSYKLNVNNAGSITSNALLDVPEDAIKQFNKNEWYRLSAVCYTETREIYVFINGVYMGKANAFKDGTTVDDNVYFQGFRINVYKSSTHKVNSSFAMDNVSVRSYTDYEYSESSADLNSITAANYITTASPRKYMKDALTVYGMPMGSMEEAVSTANKLDAKIDVNEKITIGDVNVNATFDFNGNTTIGDGSYGFVKNGDNYTFNEDYWYNAYYYNGELNRLDGAYDETDFALFGKVKLGFELDIPDVYTERTPNYNNYTVNTQNGWVYDIEATEPVIPKIPDLSDLALRDDGKNVYYLPLLDAVPMTHVVKEDSGNIVSYGITNEETENAIGTLADWETLVLLQDLTLTSSHRIRYDITGEDGIKNTVVNGVVIDNDYTDEEIATMREVASDIKIDLNGNTMYLPNKQLIIGQNIEFSIYSSKPGAGIDMFYKNGTSSTAGRTFNMMYLDDNNWNEDKESMLKIMNSRYNFGTYTDRNGKLIESETITMTGAVIYEAVTGDSSCSFNINNVVATRAHSNSNGLIVSRYFDGKINVNNSVLSAVGAGDKPWLIDVRAGDGSFHPEVVFENCLILHDGQGKNAAVSNGGPSEDASKNIVFRNCVSNLRINAAQRDHVYFGEGTMAELMLVEGHYEEKGLVEAYCWEPMTLGGFVEEGVHFIKIPKPVYDSATGTINHNNYYYFVENGYGAAFAAEYPGVTYKELPVLTTKIVKTTDAVKVTFNKLDGTAAQEVYYVKGTDVQAKASTTTAIANIALPAACTSNAFTLTATDWGTLPTNVQEDVVINPTYTYKANVTGLKANLSLYADFNVNLYLPAKYSDYVAVSVDGVGKTTASATINGAEYLMATVSQKCNMATDSIVFTLDVAEEINGNACEATVNVTISIESYASAVLGGEQYTDADKVLMYYMLDYANKAEQYIDGAANESIMALLESNAAYGAKYEADYSFANVFDIASLSGAIKEATLDIESTPKFVFTLKNGFEGTVTVSYGNGLNTRVYNVTADDNRSISIEGMKVYNFGTTLNVTAVGTVNGEAVNAEGSYSLDTFAKYHSDRSETDEASAACMPLVKALCAYAKVAELYKAGTLADALVTEA